MHGRLLIQGVRDEQRVCNYAGHGSLSFWLLLPHSASSLFGFNVGVGETVKVEEACTRCSLCALNDWLNLSAKRRAGVTCRKRFFSDVNLSYMRWM